MADNVLRYFHQKCLNLKAYHLKYSLIVGTVSIQYFDSLKLSVPSLCFLFKFVFLNMLKSKEYFSTEEICKEINYYVSGTPVVYKLCPLKFNIGV